MSDEVNKAIELLHVIRTGYICDPQECGLEKNGDVCSIFKCDDFHEALVMGIEALEKQSPKAPKEYTLYTEDSEEVKYKGCPRCKAILDRSHYFLKICSCGQKLEVE